MIDKMDEDDIIFTMLVLQCCAVMLDLQHRYLCTLLADHIREQKRLVRSLPIDKVRPTWEAFVDRTNDIHFRRMFRMSLPVFNKLWQKIRDTIGEKKFKSEEELMKNPSKYQLFEALASRGGYIPGLCSRRSYSSSFGLVTT